MAADARGLIEEQLRLGALEPPPRQFVPGARVGGAFVYFARGGSGPGSAGDLAWAAVSVGRSKTRTEV